MERTVMQASPRVMLLLESQSIEHPLTLCDHYTMEYPNKHQPIDRDAHALPLRQHLKI